MDRGYAEHVDLVGTGQQVHDREGVVDVPEPGADGGVRINDDSGGHCASLDVASW